MPKGRYDINEGKPGVSPAPKDASFKSCLCTMLLLMTLWLIVLFLVYPLKFHESPETYKIAYASRNQDDKEEVANEKYHVKSTSKQFEKIKEYPVIGTYRPIEEQPSTQYFTKVSNIFSTLIPTTAVSKKTVTTTTTTTTTTTPHSVNYTTPNMIHSATLKHSTTPSKEEFLHFSTLSNKVEQVTEDLGKNLETKADVSTEYLTPTLSDLLEISTMTTNHEQLSKDGIHSTKSADNINKSTMQFLTTEETITFDETNSSTEHTNTNLVTNVNSLGTESTTTVFEDRTVNNEGTMFTLTDEVTNSNKTTIQMDDLESTSQTMEFSTTEELAEVFTVVENKSSVTPYFERLIMDTLHKSTTFSTKDETEIITPNTETTEVDFTATSSTDTSVGELNEVTKSSLYNISVEDSVSSQIPSSDTTYELLIATTPATVLTSMSTLNPTTSSKPTMSETTHLQTLTTTPLTTTSTTTALPSTTTVPAPMMCLSDSCKVIASRMLSLINHTQDPCEDFYRFACGGLRRTPTLLEENVADDFTNRVFKIFKNENLMRNSITFQKLKNYYQSCVDYNKNVPVVERKKEGKEVFQSVGSMVVSGLPSVSLTDLLIRLFYYDNAPLFDITLDVDSKNTSNFTFVITHPKWMTSLFKNEKDMSNHCRYKPEENIDSDLLTEYQIYLKCLKNHTEFFDIAQEAMEAFSVFDPTNATLLILETRMSIEWDVLDLMEFLPITSDINLDLQTKAFEERSVGQLETNSLIQWTSLLEVLFGVPVSNDTIVQVYFPKYIDYLSQELKNKDPRKLHNALLGIFAHNLYTNLVQTNHPCDREQYCLRVAKDVMPQIMSNIYLQSFSSADLQKMFNKTTSIYYSLVSTMKEEITNSTWMDKETSHAVVKKLDSMKLSLPYLFNDTQLEHQFAEFREKSNSYLKNSVELTRMFRTYLYSRYKLSPVSPEGIWSHFLRSFSTKTLYIYGTNTLVVPLTILTPLLDSSIPYYISMAKVGYHLAQGIAHGFERTGIRYNWNGHSENIIFPASSFMYDTHVETSKTLFSYSRNIIEDKVYHFTMNSFQTLNSRLADVSAAKLTLETVHKLNGMEVKLPYSDFTLQQTFHLILLQGFCTKKTIAESVPELFESNDLLDFLRVNYIASNLEDFGNAFNCIVGSTMNPPFRSEPFPVFKDEFGAEYEETVPT